MEQRGENKVQVAGVTERRPPEQLRRIGRALIALARAQLEAEAAAKAARQGDKPPSHESGDVA